MKSKIVFDERSADVRVVTDTVAMDDGIYQRIRARHAKQPFAHTWRLVLDLSGFAVLLNWHNLGHYDVSSLNRRH